MAVVEQSACFASDRIDGVGFTFKRNVFRRRGFPPVSHRFPVVSILSQLCPYRRMDSSFARASSSRFPYFLPGRWSSRRSHHSISTQTTSPEQAEVAGSAHTPSTHSSSVHTAERINLCREAASREVTDELENLVGHDNVKRQLVGVQSWVQICRRHGRDPCDEWYNIAFQGNPGTGKSTVARIYAKMLFSMGISDSASVKETSGTELLAKGPDGVKDLLHTMTNATTQTGSETAGVLVIDSPHVLSQALDTASAKRTMDYILEAMERKLGRVVVVFVGRQSDLETFLTDNPRLRDKICSTLQFGDFDRGDLVKLLWRRIHEGYRGRMQVEGGPDSPYLQAVARRLARGRGEPGFRNAHAVRDLVATIARRQAECLMEQQDNGMEDVDYFFFSRHDLLGPSPKDVREQSTAWRGIQNLVGQGSVKAFVRDVLDIVDENYHREIKNQRRLSLRINRVFVGPCGTGKTTAAKLYAQVLADLGVLSSGDAAVTSLSSMGSSMDSLPASSAQTLIVRVDSLSTPSDAERYAMKGILEGLGRETSDSRTRRCIILIGCAAVIEKLLPNAKSRSSVRDHQLVQFHRLDRDQIEQLVHNKLEENQIEATPEGFQKAVDILDDTRMRKDFDNAKAVERLLDVANRNFDERKTRGTSVDPVSERILESEDFNQQRHANKSTSGVRERLSHSVVPEDILTTLKRYHQEMKAAWVQEHNPNTRAARALVFKGACGTGKRAVAQQLATLYYNMGILDTDILVDCSVMDFVTPSLGQTSLRTRALLDSARGKVLFVEDAHRLAENAHTTQAMEELIYLLPKHSPHMVAILAGPSHDMDHLLANRPRLASLFQEELSFRNPTPRECLRLLDRLLSEEHIHGDRLFLTNPQTPSHREFTRAINVLSMFPCWDNVRDIDILTRWMVSACVQAIPLDGSRPLPKVQLSEEQAMQCMVKLYNLKRDRLRLNLDPKARALPRTLSQPRSTDRNGVRFPV
ncbi:hypothetical protein FE257_000156 [Aspergillus nanangensis]|uniref:AAA+ ATPase domain-containing protein n=1 Tax=Aspergillus nanangensis TaxID=2582783 RepID=A0AAD4CYZ3_ASPNN|nr:hypothetical protein FE257_000156 [Aspergillus nanangensis]